MTDWPAEYERMVEKVARAIFWAGIPATAPELFAESHWEEFKDEWKHDAQAALAAIGITPERAVWIVERSPDIELALSEGDQKVFHDALRDTLRLATEKETDDA